MFIFLCDALKHRLIIIGECELERNVLVCACVYTHLRMNLYREHTVDESARKRK